MWVGFWTSEESEGFGMSNARHLEQMVVAQLACTGSVGKSQRARFSELSFMRRTFGSIKPLKTALEALKALQEPQTGCIRVL